MATSELAQVSASVLLLVLVAIVAALAHMLAGAIRQVRATRRREAR